jgi:hypothetical protein
MPDGTQTLTQMIKILQPLSSDERHRNIEAALTFLGDKGFAATSKPNQPSDGGGGGGDHDHPAARAGRMKQYGIASAHVERVFDFRDDGTFAILDVPGSAMREQTLNIYILTGLGTFLATGGRQFADPLARAYCEEHSCLDGPNHSKTLGGKHPEFSGDKNNGWSITVPGIKRGAELVKQVAEAASK